MQKQFKRTRKCLGFIAKAALAGIVAANAMGQTPMQEGKKLFTQTAAPACAICHTLKHAGATGEVGPNLDELMPNAQRVEKAVRNGIGQMPANTNLSDAELRLLATYVANASRGMK